MSTAIEPVTNGRRCRRMLLVVLCAAALASSLAAADPLSDLLRQTPAQVAAKSSSCVACHQGIEDMHQGKVPMGCTDCHGGNSQAAGLRESHVLPRHPGRWPTAANPERSFTWLNDESPEFIRFVNPGDLRVAEISCGGACHGSQVLRVKKSMMSTSALLWGSASYNNGILSNKRYILGESYTRDSKPARVNTVPPPTAEEMSRGVLPFLVPLPRWEITQPGDNFRAFERGGRVGRGNPSEIGIPDPFEEPGRPDMKLGDRGFGTQLRISSPVLNLQKTRLNDPHLWYLGTNDNPGDYRSSGCTACHVVYANDRSPVHSGPYSRYGNRGRSATRDTTISKTESGHPIRHVLTNAIPSSQCMVCHMHQPNAFVNTFYGFQMWDYETDGEPFYPAKQQKLSDAEAFATLARNPEEAALRGLWRQPEFLAESSRLNPKLQRTQFADYHGHGWMFRAVFKKDRKGNMLDRDGAAIPADSPHKFHGVVVADTTGPVYCDEECRQAKKAVHLQDIHAEKGMHCVDCHFSQDAHGSGKLYGEFHDAIEITCIDCHGTVTDRAALRTSGPAAPEGGTALTDLITPFGEKRFARRGKRIIQRSAVDSTLKWDVPQVVETIDPKSPNYNAKARAAKCVATDGGAWQPAMGDAKLAHSNRRMECYSCHTSWVTNCFGCHLPQQANWKKMTNHFEGEVSRNWTTYNPQVLRDDGFMLCVGATTKGNKIVPARSSSALVLSSRNANREQTYGQVAPVSAPGYSSQAFNPHFPHAVRKTETRTCTDCHLSKKNDNNAWMAQVLLQGTNLVNFMGRYAWVGLGSSGFEGVAVAEVHEPQAVIGSALHHLAYPDDWQKHQERKGALRTSHHHGGTEVLGLQLRGDYLFTANGADGFRVYDVANVDNKGFSERVVSAPVSPLGQRARVDTKFATAVALPTTMPIDTRRLYRPENQEQWPMHPLYSYACITDREEGLILVDVMPLVNRDPTDNFLRRAITFNPGGMLTGAVNLAIAGNYVYVCCSAGLVVVSLDDPLRPRIVTTIGGTDVVEPRAVALQFRYAFVCDAEGFKVIDVTNPERPVRVPENMVPLADARDVYVARTYAYVAAGAQGLVIIDVERPDAVTVDQIFTGGQIHDATAVRVASTNASIFAYLADGDGGLKVIQLTFPDDPAALGFSPRPTPWIVATRHTHGPAIALSKGMDRDRAVDESGNQVSVFGRLGSRPLSLDEQKRLYLRDGKPWFVSDTDGLP